MLGVIANSAMIILGGLVGLLFRSKIKGELVDTLMASMGLVILVIGIDGAAGVQDILAVVICLAVGGLIGHALRLQSFFDGLGETIHKKLKNTRFAEGEFGEGLVTASVLFTVGSMAILGSIEAGLNHNYTILITKGVIDMVSAIALAAAMGAGVPFSFIPVFIWEAVVTLFAAFVSPYLGAEVVANMSAVGGAIFIGMGINMLGISKTKIRVNDMLPALLLPVVYTPIANWIGGLL